MNIECCCEAEEAGNRTIEAIRNMSIQVNTNAMYTVARQ